MKKGLLVLLAIIGVTGSVFAYNYDTKVPVAGNSIADTKLQSDMLFPVYSYGLRIATPECKDYAITNTEVSVPKKDGNWTEIWTVKACERVARIPIEFTTNSNNEVNFAIDPMGVKVQK